MDQTDNASRAATPERRTADRLADPGSRPTRTPRVSRRGMLFIGVLVAYVVLTLGVVHRSPLLTIDTDVLHLDLRERWPALYPTINTYVMLGQRAPATLVALPWFLWMTWRYRTARPLITLVTALFVLNLSVGVVKLATGRLGPLRTHQAHAVFDGGNIFPSGHVSNAVVLYGVVAMLAVNHRRLAAAAAAFLSVTVGLSTIYLDTHWLTDVVGGWLAGALVLLSLPTLVPLVERAVAAAWRGVLTVWSELRSVGEDRSPARAPVGDAASASRRASERVRPARAPRPAIQVGKPKAPAKL